MLKPMLRQAWLMILLAGPVLSCSSEDDPVNLSVAVADPTLEFHPGQFGGSLEGTFELKLTLGSYAPAAVMLARGPSLKLLNSEGDSVVDPLKAEATTGSFPLELQPGDTQSVLYRVEDSQVLNDEESGKTCAGPVKISGLVSDDDQQQTTFSSAKLEVKGCSQ